MEELMFPINDNANQLSLSDLSLDYISNTSIYYKDDNHPLHIPTLSIDCFELKSIYLQTGYCSISHFTCIYDQYHLILSDIKMDIIERIHALESNIEQLFIHYNTNNKLTSCRFGTNIYAIIEKDCKLYTVENELISIDKLENELKEYANFGGEFYYDSKHNGSLIFIISSIKLWNSNVLYHPSRKCKMKIKS